MEWKFRIPSNKISSEFSEDELGHDVVVVSFFGKSNFDDDGPIVDDYSTDFTEIPIENDQSYNSYIDGYYSKSEKVVYLFLIGAYNPITLVRLLSNTAQEFKEKGFLHCYNKCRSSYGRALLYLFSISHIVVICHPNSIPDLNVVQLLKVLSALRPTYQSLVSDVLGKLANSSNDSEKQKTSNSQNENLKEILTHGRLCSPRLLFLFESPLDISLEEEEKRATRTMRLQHSLEDQLYIILRKCRLVKNLCNRALFSIAPNDEFVHVQHRANTETPVEHCFRSLMEKLEMNETEEERNETDETLGAHLLWNTLQPIDPDIDKIWRRKPLDSMTYEIPQDFAVAPQNDSLVFDETKTHSNENAANASNPDWNLALLSNDFSSLSMYPEFIPRSYDQTVIENCAFEELSQPRNIYELYGECNPWTAAVQEGSYYDPCAIPSVALEDYYLPTPYTGEINPELWQYSVIPEDPQYVDEGLGCVPTDVQEAPHNFMKKPSSCASSASSSSSNSSPFWALSDDENFNQFKPTKTGKRFRTFLLKHIKKAHNEGFNDNMGKFSNMKPFFVKPKLKEWLQITEAISNELKLGLTDFESSSQFQFGTELLFSSARCKKIIPIALAHYQESLPSHYNRSVHERQLKKAIDVFTHHARGPEQEKHIEELKVQCENIWKTRHTCDALSLSKNSCTKPAQQCNSTDPDKEVEHWSGIQCVSTCNCGMKQGSRPDPFSVKAANFSFYVDIGKECGCISLDHVKFPVFQPSIHDFKAANFHAFGYEKPTREENLSCSVNTLANLYQELNENSVQNSLSVGNIGKLWSPAHSDSPANEDGTPAASQLSDQSGNLVLDYFDPNNQEKHLVRQASTTEYLPGMIHIDSPRGLLPQFPSWSLICRGPSSLYSHNLGLHDQPGFILGSSYLLPWDVVIGENNEISNAAVSELKKAQNSTYSSRAGYKKYQRHQKDHINVKIFIGVEYECLRGHRFMSSAPGKILQVSANGIVKENANKITKGNMPLYLSCPCGKSIAQLMRIHVVTPKAPVYVTVDPKVRPGPIPCPTFVTGNQKPIALTQSTYWVLRLPFVYVSERSVYSIPNRVKKMKHGELIGPTYGITQITE